MAGVRRQARVIHALHPRMREERLGDRGRVLGMTLHAELQRLDPAQREPTIKGTRHAAERVLQEAHGFEDLLVLRNDRTLNHVQMPGQILRDALNHQIRTEGQRLLEVRCGKCVVHDHNRTGLMGDTRHGFDVIHEQTWVGRRLEPDKLRSHRDRSRQRIQITEVHPLDNRAEGFKHLVQQPECAAIHVHRHHDRVARLQVRLQNRILSRETRSEHRALRAAFEFGQHSLEALSRGIRRPRVVKALVLPGAFLLIGRCLKDGRHHRTGVWFGWLTRVDGLRGEMHCLSPG